MRRSSCNANRFLTRSVRFRLLAGHMVAASGRYVGAQLSAERAHVGNDLPSLVLGNASAPCWHAIRTALHDAGEDVGRLASIDPLVVHQRRTNSATPIGVAAYAIELLKES